MPVSIALVGCYKYKQRPELGKPDSALGIESKLIIVLILVTSFHEELIDTCKSKISPACICLSYTCRYVVPHSVFIQSEVDKMFKLLLG